MIYSKIIYKNEFINSIEVKGHANYDVKGKDIVCAAVSTAIIVTYNAIKHLNLDNNVTHKINDGYFLINVLNNNDIVNSLLKNLEHTLIELEKDYKKYMKHQKEG